MLLTKKIKLDISEQDAATLEFMQGKCRGLYNWWVMKLRTGERWPGWRKAKKTLKASRQHDPELNGVYNKLLQEVYFRLDAAMQAFFRRLKKGEKPGFPRVRPRHCFFTLIYFYHIAGFKGSRWYNRQLDTIRSKRDRCKKGSRRYKHLSQVYKRVSQQKRNKQLNRAVFNDWGLFTFVQMLLYKCLLYGKEFVILDERDTSKTCSACEQKQDMPLWKRTYRCPNPECRLVIDRDENSAVNILKRYLARLGPHMERISIRCADVFPAIEDVNTFRRAVSDMQHKRVSLVINPRTGQNVAKITDVIAVLAAAGWKTDIALKEYGGHTMKLANEAAKDGSDLVIAYGGDGTLNQVVNGVMNAKGQHSIVGVIPGGTANVWAGEVGVPTDPVKAALSLVNSEPRKVDIGHVEVVDLAFPATSLGEQQGHSKKKVKVGKASSKARHHFLLMAGLGIDAAVMQNVSKPLKYRIGPLAVGLSAAKELPAHHPFPVEILIADDGEPLWRGEALQVVVGNTRRYGDIAEMTPNAYIDDGVLDVCVITAGDPLTTLQQIASLLLRKKPDNLSAEYFHGSQLYIRVPASVPMQLDGSAVKLKDYLNASDYDTLQQVRDVEQVMVTYRFNAMPRALQIAIPCTYDNTLFEQSGSREQEASDAKSPVMSHPHKGDETATTLQHHSEEEESQASSQVHQEESQEHGERSEDVQKELPALVNALFEHGRKVSVVGKAPHAARKDTYIIAGSTPKQSTGEMKPAAVVVNGNTSVFNREGMHVSADAVQELQEGATIVVEGKKNKRGVIQASRVVL